LMAVIAEWMSFRKFFFQAVTKDGTQSTIRARTSPVIKRRNTSCRIETEPAQRIKGHNQDREAEKGKSRKAPAVEKGQKTEAVREPVAAAEAAARGSVIMTLRINNTSFNSMKTSPEPSTTTFFVWVRGGKEIWRGKNIDCWL